MFGLFKKRDSAPVTESMSKEELIAKVRNESKTVYEFVLPTELLRSNRTKFKTVGLKSRRVIYLSEIQSERLSFS